MNSATAVIVLAAQRRARSLSFAVVALLLSVALVATAGGTAAFGVDEPLADAPATAAAIEADPDGGASVPATALNRGLDPRRPGEGATEAPSAAITAELPDHTVNGRVVLPPGAVMEGAIYFYDAETFVYIGYTEPDEDGRFNVITGPGSFKIQFWGFTGAAPSFYGDKPTPVGATNVTASASGTGIGKVKLAPESSISGNFALTNSSWDDTVCVDAVLFPYGDESFGWSLNYDCALRAGGDGEWTIDGLAKGDYRLYFYDYEGTGGVWWDGPVFEDAVVLPLGKGEDEYLHTGPFSLVASGDSDVVLGETVTLGLDLDADIDGTVKLESKTPSGSWKTVSGGMPMVDGVAVRDVTPTTGITYRATYGYRTDTRTGWTQVPVSAVQLDPQAYYFSGQPFVVAVVLGEPGNGTAKLEQRVNGGKWSKIDGGVKIVDGSGSRWLTRKSGDTVEYRATFDGVTSDVEAVTRIVPTWTNTGGGDFYKGASYDIEFEADNSLLEGEGKLYVKKGSKPWKKVSNVDIVAGVATATVKPTAKKTQYQLRSGKDKSDPIVFTRVKPDLLLELDDPSHATPYTGDTFDLYLTVAAPDGATIDAYTGPVTLKVRKPGGSWKTVLGGITVTDGSGSVTPTALKGKRQYQVVFGGSKSNIILITGVTPPP